MIEFKEYVIDSDAFQFILKKKVGFNKDNEQTYKTLGFYTTLEGLFSRMLDKELLVCVDEKNTTSDLLNKIIELKSMISDMKRIKLDLKTEDRVDVENIFDTLEEIGIELDCAKNYRK